MGQDEGKRIYGVVDPSDTPRGQGEGGSPVGTGGADAAIPPVTIPGQMIVDDISRSPAPLISSAADGQQLPPESPQGCGFPPTIAGEEGKSPGNKSCWLIAAGLLLGFFTLLIIAGAAYWATTSFKKLDADISNAKEQVASLQGELAEAKNGITILEGNLAQKKIDYTSLQGNYKSTEEQHSSLSTDYTSLQSQNEQHQDELSTAKELGITLGYDLKKVQDSNQTTTSKLAQGYKYAELLNAFLKVSFGRRLSDAEFSQAMAGWRRLVNAADDSTLEQYYDDFISASKTKIRSNYEILIAYLINKCVQYWQ
jgi:hypothetical protein